MELTIEPAVLVGFCLALVRATAWVVVCPPFNSPAIPVRIRVGFATALAFVLAPRFAASTADLGTAGFVGSLFVQAFAGLALGAIVFVLFSAVQAAGELIDLQVGFSLGGVIDPLEKGQAHLGLARRARTVRELALLDGARHAEGGLLAAHQDDGGIARVRLGVHGREALALEGCLDRRGGLGRSLRGAPSMAGLGAV